MKIKVTDPVFICEHCGKTFDSSLTCARHEKNCRQEDIELYSNWGKFIMKIIEEIGRKKYPDLPYWNGEDSGPKWNVCLLMLERFEKELLK